jgi:hypothetical protein
MIIFTINFDPDSDSILLLDPGLLKQIISYPGGSGSGATTWPRGEAYFPMYEPSWR